MKGIRVLFLFILILLTISGCAKTLTVPMTSLGYSQKCQLYVGRDTKILFKNWGYPERTFETSEGNKVYAYQQIIDRYNLDILSYTPLSKYPPIIRNPEAYKDVTGGYRAYDNCITYFVADANKIIIKVVWKGDCMSRERE